MKAFKKIIIASFAITIFLPGLSKVESAGNEGGAFSIPVRESIFKDGQKLYTVKDGFFNVKNARKKQASSNKSKSFSITIMHINDSHAHVEQYPRLFTAVNKFRREKKDSLLVMAGDVFTGTPYFLKYLGQADLFFMNQFGFDAMTLGNHEFDKDSKTLADFIKNMKFSMVSSNVSFKDDPVLNPFFINKIGIPGESGKIYPAIIKEYGDEKIGVIGLTTQDTYDLANPDEHIVFENPVKKAQKTIDALNSEGIDKIIVLSHLGYETDIKLANEVNGIDIIVGGHSHTALDEPVVIGKREPTVIVQTGGYLESLGLLNITFNEKGIITTHNGKLISLESYEEDPQVFEMLAEFKEPLKEAYQKVIGQTDVFLNGERSDVRYKETKLGNLVTDAMVEKANEYIKTHIAIQDGGGIRTSIPKGDITLWQILTVLPFESKLVILNLTGEEIWESLENSVSEAEKGEGRFAQVSGIRFKYDVKQPPAQRVWQVEVKTEHGFEVLNPNKSYNVVTNAFMADGRGGYTAFKKAKEEGRITELSVMDFEALVSYLKEHSPVKPKIDSRIIQKAKTKNSPEEPVVDQITDQSLVVSGKTDADAPVNVKIGKESFQGAADEKGIFQIFIPEQKAGTLISVISLDQEGKERVPTDIIVKDETPPKAPVVEEVSSNSKKVIGIAEENAIITVKIGKKTYIGKANRKGHFKVKIPPQNAGTQIKVTAKDKAGNKSKTTSAKIITTNKKEKYVY